MKDCSKPRFHAGTKPSVLNTIFSNFTRVDFDTFFIQCSCVPVDVKSAKKLFVAISSRLIQYNAWTNSDLASFKIIGNLVIILKRVTFYSLNNKSPGLSHNFGC